MSAFLLGVLAGYGIAIPVGAIAAMIVQVGMRCGFWCAASAGAGAATADLLYAGLAVTGGAALATSIQAIGAPLRWISATVLMGLAIRGLVTARHKPAATAIVVPDRREHAKTYLMFLGLTAINPMTVVYFAAIVLGLGLTDDLGAGGGALFVAGAFLASLSWQTTLAGAGALLRRKASRRAQVGAVVLGNMVIIALSLLIITR